MCFILIKSLQFIETRTPGQISCDSKWSRDFPAANDKRLLGTFPRYMGVVSDLGSLSRAISKEN